MNELLKLMGQLIKAGFASSDNKAKVATLVSKLKDADQEAVADQAETVSDLPEDAPEGAPAADADKDGASDEEVEKGIKALFSREGARIEKSMKESIKEYMDEQKELMAQKAGAYNPDVKAKRKEINTRLRDLSKALLAGDAAKLKEMTTDDTGTPYAGYTVDSELSAEIRHLITEYGVARREMEVLPLTKGSYKANDLATDVTVYWVDEGGAIASTQAVLGQEELTLKKLAAIVTLTNELLEDTEIDFVSFLGGRVAEGFAKAEDEAFFIGDGTATYGSFTGLTQATDVNEVVMDTGNTAFTDLTAEYLIDMVDETPTGAIANAKYYLHRTIMSVVRKLREDAVSAADGAGAFIYQAPSQSGPATIWGYPAVPVEAMPAIGDSAVSTSFVLFGDLRKACIFGYKGGIKMSRFNAGVVRNVADDADVNLITSDREAVRWTNRIGYIRIIPTAVTKLTTSAT